jgi:ribonuclease-3
MNGAFEGLEERLRLTFTDRELLGRALTHPSYSLEHGGDDYERLEFLGDSVLAWVVATDLFESFPELPEGDLTRMKVALTSGRTLAGIGRELGLGPCLRFGRGAARESDRDSVLENAYEALVGALYLDAGPDAAREFVLASFGPRIERATILATVSDPKSRLQELTQRAGSGLPSYEIVDRSGPVHEPHFTASVTVAGSLLGTGEGPSKQDAQRAAAVAALLAMDAG